MSAPEEKFVKKSAVLISSGKKVRLYGSVDEVPSRLRKRLIESTSSINSGTILIANRAGRERILEALRSLPKGARSQILSVIKGKTEAPCPAPRRWRRAAALALSLGAGAALCWLLASLRHA
jgi:hypothetical protein